MATCLPVAWGDAPWGLGAWSGISGFPGGPLPFSDDFNIYCAGPCGEMSVFLDYEDVTHFSGTGQFTVDLNLSDLVVSSGGAALTDTARIFVNKLVGSAWTLECTFRLDDMPSDFGNLTQRHFFVGTADEQGGCGGLFISSVGLGYTGSTEYDSSGNLVINSAMQVLPNSIGLVLPGVFYTIRIVVDANTSTTYIYVTETDQVPIIGHQLKYILPTFLSAGQIVNPIDGTTISLRGTFSEPVVATLNSLCLGDGVIIPNIPPVADAGVDQAARACSIVRLDGRKSFDPEGANLIYQWRLIDGPMTSVFVLIGDDGHTIGSTETNKFYSEEAQAFATAPGIDDGDVLLLDGAPYTIVGTGTDINGFYVQVDGFALDGGLPAQPFRILKQHTVSGATTAQPTFYPDIPGIYKFDLTVFDGGLFSLPANIIVNVTESPVPRGLNPDVGFLWNYISDFWKLVDNTAVIETFWGALAQLAASELLTLWQTEYSKSLRDIQQTFQRRWLHYDLFIQEPQIEDTTVRSILAGVQTVDIDPAASVNIAGETLVVLLPDGSTNEIFLTQPVSATPQLTTDAIQAFLQLRLRDLDNRFVVDRLVRADGHIRFIVTAPFPFVFSAASTATALFAFPARNDLPRGSGGSTIGVNGYRVDRSLADIDIETGDYLVVGGTAYRIVRVITDPSDAWGSQRIVTSDDLPLTLGADWVICGATRSVYLDFYNSLCSAGDTAIYEIVETATGALTYISASTISAAGDAGTALLTEHAPIAQFIFDPAFEVYFYSIYRRTNMPVDDLVVEIPTLQELIRNTDDTQVLRQNIDFFRTEFRGHACIQFVTGNQDVWQGGLPPARIWAETTYIDNRPVIEQNFGIPAEFTLDDLAELTDNIDYLSCVRGLWYAYFNGPTLYNLRVGTQILLGLPFAEEAGTIVELDDDFSSAQGRFLIQDTNEQAIVRSYTFPRVLALEVNPATGLPYAVGDTVVQFAPLVEGVEVVDYVKDPTWFQAFLTQGSFFEVEKFFKFLVRVDSAAFNLNTLLFATEFIKRIKPTFTFPIFAVKTTLGDDTTVNTDDNITYSGKLSLWAGAWFANHTGQATMFDHPHAGGGGYWNQFDSGPAGPYGASAPMSNWGFDQELLSPNEHPLATLTRVISVAELPAANSIYYADLPIWTNVVATIIEGMRFWIPLAGYQIGLAQTMTQTVTINKAVVFLRTIAPVSTPIVITIKKNGTTVLTQNYTIPYNTERGPHMDAAKVHFQINTSLAVAPGDVLTAFIAHGTKNFNTFIETSAIILGVGQDWFAGTNVGPGTFKTVIPL